MTGIARVISVGLARLTVAVRSALPVVVFALVAACRDRGGSNDAADGGSGSTTSADDTADGGVPGDCEAEGIGTAPLRRLTHREYDATIRDLLGDDSNPSQLLPTDAAATGFDTKASAQQINATLAEAYMRAAEDVAARAVVDTAVLLPCDPAPDELACGHAFVGSFGPRVFRRPLAPDELSRYQTLFDNAHASWGFDKAVELVVQAMLQSPSFLFRLEFGLPEDAGEPLVRLTSWETASRLSYLLWGTMPDEDLFAAAAEDRLGTPEELAAQADRMLDDPRARGLVGAFHRQWLGLDGLAISNKNPATYPQWSPELAASMATETTMLLEHVVFDGAGDFATLLRADYTFVDSSLAALYDVAGPQGNAFARVELPADRRAGLLTHASLLALSGKPDQSSPVLRGQLVRERLLCESLPEPPPNVDTTPPEVDPDASTRERFEQHTSDPSCAACHRLIDPVGFGLEHYDGIGVWRDQDGGAPVDASGVLVIADQSIEFDGAIELGDLLATHPNARDCFVAKWFEFGHGRAPDLGDSCTIEGLRAGLEAADGDVRSLLVALTQTDAFRLRPASE